MKTPISRTSILALTFAITTVAVAAAADIAATEVESISTFTNDNGWDQKAMEAGMHIAAIEYAAATGGGGIVVGDAWGVSEDGVEGQLGESGEDFDEDEDEVDGDDEDEDEDGDDDEDEDEDEDGDEEDGAEGEEFDEAVGFHLAEQDPLLEGVEQETGLCNKPEQQPQQLQQQQQEQEQEQEQDTTPSFEPTLQKRDDPAMVVVDPTQTTDTNPNLSALATAEPGGACLDSFVNFALRFRERCTIKCLKTFTHIFVNPDVLGALDCFGCTNFVVAGFYALGVDCAGIFGTAQEAAQRKKKKEEEDLQKTMTKSAKGWAVPTVVGVGNGPKVLMMPTNPVKLMNGGGSNGAPVVIAGDQQQEKPLSAHPPGLDFGAMLKGLKEVKMEDVQDWLEIGQGIVKAVSPVEGMNGTMASPVKTEVELKADKELFNKFVSKAASFGNWGISPEFLDATGIFDRFHEAGLL